MQNEQFDTVLAALGLQGVISKYDTNPQWGQNKFDDNRPGVTGFLLYLKDAASAYQIFGGTGPGDAFQLVQGRFEYGNLRTAPDWGITPYEQKHNPQPVCIIGAKISTKVIGLFVNGKQVATATSNAAIVYKNPYAINLKADERVLFAATLTDKFTKDMAVPLSAAVAQLMVSTGKLFPIPQPQQVTQTIVK